MSKKRFFLFSTKNRAKEVQLAKRIFRYFIPYKWVVLIAFLSSGLVSISTAATAWLIKPALDDIFIRKDVKAIMYIPVAFVLLTLLKGIGRYVQNWGMSYSSLCVLEKLRQELFHKIINLPLWFYETSKTGELMSYVINDVSMIRQSLPSLVQGLRQLLTMGGLLGVVFFQDFRLACWAVLVLPFAGLPFFIFSFALRRYGKRTAEVTASTSSLLQELLSGIRIIKAFANEKNETARFDEENICISKISLRQASISELSSPVMELIGAFGIAFIIWYGGMEVLRGEMTPGTFFSFVAALVMLYDPVKVLNSANMSLQNALAGAERIFELLDSSTLFIESGGDTHYDGKLKSLSFNNVTLRYTDDGIPAIKDMTFTINAGEKVALVGPSGAGKSTLINLIPRFYDPQQGTICINGINTQEYDLPSLRRSVAIVSQDAFLFNMSIRENIAYGQDKEVIFDKIKVEEAAKAAFAHDFIEALPNGYDTIVGERGVKLSGGQKQRITIARALLKGSSLLILDEATSALDSESEYMVQSALENLMKNKTSIIIAHRLSTVLAADRIFVLDAGSIVAIGQHKELLEQCELYNRLYSMQFCIDR